MNRYFFVARDVLDRIKQHAFSWGMIKFYWKTYVISQFERVSPDVYIISYPKCGRTWTRIMLKRYLELSEPGHRSQAFNDQSILRISKSLTIKFEHDQGGFTPPVKADELTFNVSKYSNKRVVCLVRDPRDVVVSNWYMLKYATNVYQGDLSEFIRDHFFGIRKIVAFLNMWVENANSIKDFYLISYEQIKKAPFSKFQEMLEFIGIIAVPEILTKAVEETSFEKMKQLEKEGKIPEPWMRTGSKNSDKSMKVRKGKVGGYVEELSIEDIQFLDDIIKENLTPKLPYHRDTSG